MGRGDRRTKKGKTWRGTYGNARPHKPEVVEAPPKKAKKAASKAKKD